MPWPKSTKAIRVPKASLHSANCPTRIILDDVMSRWGSLVLVLLLERSYRFSELAYLIGGVSEKMLAQTLQWLAADGFVIRTAYDEVPPHVDYRLTPLGEEVARQVTSLADWIEVNLSRILSARTVEA